MPLGHVKIELKDLDAFLKKYKEHLRFTDEEFDEYVKSGKWFGVLVMGSPIAQNKVEVFEVVESHGCLAGMRPGDKMYVRAGTFIEVKRSDDWCAYALSYLSAQIALGVQTLIKKGSDPNDLYVKYLSCASASPKYGGSCGNVIFKIYAIDESKTQGK
ncbi:MAG: hypothetical protein QW222_03755 [Candidatus Bathyarchaeia archaeon]